MYGVLDELFPNRPSLPAVVRVGPRELPVTERDVERFFAKVQIDGTQGCWEWTAGRDRADYGRFELGGAKGGPTRAHRVAYTVLVGPIADGLVLDHLCRNTRCVNPEHLEPVTIRTNTLRGLGLTAVAAAQTHCIHGHEFTRENTYTPSGGGRTCRACARGHHEAYKAENREKVREIQRTFAATKRAARRVALDALPKCGVVTRRGKVCDRPAGHNGQHFPRPNDTNPKG